jgi:hypothetical protein
MSTASPWATIRPALIDVFTFCAADQILSPGEVSRPFETPLWAAEWKDRRVSFIHPGQGHALYLKINTIVGRGWDDYAWTSLDTGLAAGLPATGLFDVFEVSSGYRRFTLQAQSWCLEDTEELTSSDIIERIRTRMYWERNIQSLLGANVSCDDILASRDMTATIDKKRFSITALDFVFTACVIETDPIPTGWIEHVILTSHEQVGGIDVAASLRMIAEELPPAV